MKPLRFLAATVAALCALGLSVGAALAEGQHAPAKPVRAGQSAPEGLCVLYDLSDLPRARRLGRCGPQSTSAVPQ